MATHFRRPSFKRPRRHWYPPGGTTANTILTAETGSFLLNGQDLAFYASIIVEAGSFTLNGQDTAFNVTMPVDAGSYALTGQAITFNVSLAAETGAYTLNGQDVIFNTSMVADAGAYALTGIDVTFTVTMPVETGSYALTGNDIVTALVMPIEPGSFLLTGQDAAFSLTTHGGGSDRKKRVRRDPSAAPLKAKRRKIRIRKSDGRIVEKDYLDEFKPPLPIEELGLPPLLPVELPPAPTALPPAWLLADLEEQADVEDALAVLSQMPDPAVAHIRALAGEAQEELDLEDIGALFGAMEAQAGEIAAMREAQDIADIEAIFAQL